MSLPGAQIAVVGCGYWGKNLVRNFAELGALAAICDPDRANAEKLAAASRSRVIGWQPLLEDASVNGARGVIINVTGGPDMSLMEVNEALTVIQEAAHEDANIIFGAVVDPLLQGRIKITVIATGFDHMRHMTHSAGATAPMQTPVDLQSYTQVSRSQPAAAPAAAMAEAAMAARFTIARRPSIDPPLAQARQQMMMAAAGSGGGPAESSDLDLNLELEVPAFLRREG